MYGGEGGLDDTLTVSPLDTPPPGVGFETATVLDPVANPHSDVVICVLLTNVELYKADPATRICDPETNPVPVNVSRPVAHEVKLAGETEASVGNGLLPPIV